MKQRSSRIAQTRSFHLSFYQTAYSIRIYISRNGICLERLGSISTQGKLMFIFLNNSRLIFWLKRGVRVDKRLTLLE